MTVSLGHFDICDLWALQVYWKMLMLLFVTHGNTWELSKKHPLIPLKARLHPQMSPKHNWTLQNTLRYPKHIPLSPKNSLDYSQAIVETVWEPFGLSRDVREDFRGNEGFRWCMLSVRNVCECWGLHLSMSRIGQGWYRSLWGHLRVCWGCWRV